MRAFRSTPLYSTPLGSALHFPRSGPSAECALLRLAGGCEAVGLDWIGLSTFIHCMDGLQFEPMGM
jgi:hypothetical protein